MSGSRLLDWAVLSVSLFNTIVLLWLGLTVLLNAEQRTWGLWLAGGGLLAGAAFFVSHSAILGHNLTFLGPGTEFWWRVGWAPLIVLPYAWYTLMLWYAGFWTPHPGAAGTAHPVPSLRRHRPWWAAATAIAAGFLGLVLAGGALPTYWQLVQFDLTTPFSLGTVPLLLATYPLYAVLCVALALRALARPAPSPLAMRDLARQRSRPWLAAASVALLVTSVLVVGALVWVTRGLQRGVEPQHYAWFIRGVAGFDLAAAGAVGAALVFLGQAIVSYEVFTGRVLPRRGFFNHWRRALILAGSYSAAVAATVVIDARPIYSLLLTTVLMTSFYALVVWRSFSSREQALEQLRPFMASQGLYEHLLEARAPVDMGELFKALCAEVLGASLAYLVPVGASVPLAGEGLIFPEDAPRPALSLQRLIAELERAPSTGLPVDPGAHGGAGWVVPLLSERRLVGLLFLGNKRDGGFYTQEEMDLARAGGERLIDLCVSAEMARRLMVLQRQKLAASAVVDQGTRRVLHDEVLPNLHAALLLLSAGDSEHEVAPLLARTHRQVSDLLRDLPSATVSELDRLGLVGALRQVVADEFRGAFDQVRWEIGSCLEERLQNLPALCAEVVFYAAREVLRNAAQHARPAGRQAEGTGEGNLVVTVGADEAHGLALWIEDNGEGMDPSREPEPGRGHGLALHGTMMAVTGGALEVESAQGSGTRVTLRLPGEGWWASGAPSLYGAGDTFETMMKTVSSSGDVTRSR